MNEKLKMCRRWESQIGRVRIFTTRCGRKASMQRVKLHASNWLRINRINKHCMADWPNRIHTHPWWQRLAEMNRLKAGPTKETSRNKNFQAIRSVPVVSPLAVQNQFSCPRKDANKNPYYIKQGEIMIHQIFLSRWLGFASHFIDHDGVALCRALRHPCLLSLL